MLAVDVDVCAQCERSDSSVDMYIFAPREIELLVRGVGAEGLTRVLFLFHYDDGFLLLLLCVL